MKHRSTKHSKKQTSKPKTIEYTLKLNTKGAKKELAALELRIIRLQARATKLQLTLLKLSH